jgi:nitroreductase
MEFKVALAKRRMVRNYSDASVPLDALDRIARAALRAPSAGNSQGVAVVIVTDKAKRRQIAELADEPEYVQAGFDPWISRAPAHIVISVSEKVYRDRYDEPDKLDENGDAVDWPVPYWWIDSGASMMAVLLAVVDEGLTAGFLGVHNMPALGSLLGLPRDYLPIGVITVGHPAPDRRSGSLARGKKPDTAVIHYNEWSPAS